MKHLARVVLLTVFGLGCGAAPPPRLASQASATAPATTLPADALSARLDRIVGELAPRGYTPLPGAARGFMLEGDSAAHAIELPAGACVTVIAVASVGVRDLDARLYAAEGTLLDEDDEPDPHPIVQTCATEAARAYWTGKMFAGNGAYRFVVLRADRAALPAAVALLRGDAGPEPARSRLDQRLAERVAEVQARGFSSRGEPMTLTLGRAEAIRIALPVERGGCYTMVALGGDGIGGLDLDISDEDGLPVATDASTGPDALTQLCTETEETLSAELRAGAGAGEVRFVVLGAPSETVGGAGRLWLGERLDRPGDVAITRAIAMAEERLRRAGATLRPTAAPLRIQQREVQTQSVQVRAGSCTAIVAVGGRGVGRLRVSAFGAEGDPIADPVVGVAGAALRLCPGRPVAARVDVEALRGWGEVALVVADEPPAAVVRGARPLLAARLQGLVAEATGEGFAIAGAPVGGVMPAGALRQHPGVSDARCVRFVAAADGFDTEVHLYLLDRSGRRLSADRAAGGAARIELCDAPGQAATIEVRVEHAAGDVDYRVVRLLKN